jgi:hypothetical protein
MLCCLVTVCGRADALIRSQYVTNRFRCVFGACAYLVRIRSIFVLVRIATAVDTPSIHAMGMLSPRYEAPQKSRQP